MSTYFRGGGEQILRWEDLLNVGLYKVMVNYIEQRKYNVPK